MIESWSERVVVHNVTPNHFASCVKKRLTQSPVKARTHGPGMRVQLHVTVLSCVVEVLGTQVSSDTPLMEAGVDSLGATELQRALGERLSTEAEATLLFDYPSIERIVQFFSEHFQNDVVGPALASPCSVDLAALEAFSPTGTPHDQL